MSRKRDIDADVKEFRSVIRKHLNAGRSANFVTFNKRHMQLDVNGFLRSDAGSESLKKVIQLSSKLSKKLAEAS